MERLFGWLRSAPQPPARIDPTLVRDVRAETQQTREMANEGRRVVADSERRLRLLGIEADVLERRVARDD